MWQNLVGALVLGSTYSLIAVGLSMVYGILKILHVAHAGIYTLGAYVGLYSLYAFNNNLWVALLIAMIASGLVGVLIYRGVYYYMLTLPRIIPLIASIGLFIFLEDFYRLLAGPYGLHFPAYFSFPQIKTAAFSITDEQLLILVLTAAFFLAVYWLVFRTRVGLGWQACSQDVIMAAACGINIRRAVALNFFLGSALAGAAGVLIALYRNSVFPTMGEEVAYKAFVVVVLGGFGSIGGSLVAGLLLALAETFLGGLGWFTFPKDAIAFLVLIFTLMFRPKGLFGRL